jgi:hypothetical protein
MAPWAEIEQAVMERLGLSRRPVAVARYRVAASACLASYHRERRRTLATE